MTFLSQHLHFPSSSSSSSSFTSFPTSASSSLPPPSSHLLVSDTLTSPAYFILYHLILTSIQQQVPVIWVDIRNQGRASLESVAKKLGTCIPSSFIHISPSLIPNVDPFSSSSIYKPNILQPSSSLRPIYDSIDQSLSSFNSSNRSGAIGALVLLDGLSELQWIDFKSVDVVRFVRAVFAKVRAINGILVSTIHADSLPLTDESSPHNNPSLHPSSSHSPHSTSTFTSTNDIEGSEGDLQLLNRLLRISDFWWRVSGLASGRSGEVSGEISCHLDPTCSIPRSAPLQYRLEPSAVKVFPKGTGRGYL